MRMSAAGIAALRQHEQVVLNYYPDQAGNCTYGIGTLAHLGPCTPVELQRPVTLAQVAQQMGRYVYVHPFRTGRRQPAVRFQGLANRRRNEAAPFQQQGAGR
jgi:GH24 family phage-related lysozyme (muramidase)